MGLKWQSTFTSNKGLQCTLLISARGYTGTPIDITLTGTPVVHTWQTDEAKPAIKGSELEINILNRGTLPVTDFMASEDDFFFVEFKVGAATKFKGFLVQDDYSEALVDYPHEIRLKATDNIGLLKDVSLLDAAISNGSQTTSSHTIEQIAPDKIRFVGDVLTSISTFQYVIINSGTTIDGQYQIKAWQYVGLFDTVITFRSNLNGTISGTHTASITYITPVDLSQKMYLSELLSLSMKAINVPLFIRVYSSLYADGTPQARLFDQVKITPESFSNNDNWDSCYQVIEKILNRFKFTLFQAEGFYNFVRWDELAHSNNSISGRSYNADFVYLGVISLATEFTFGFGGSSFPETGLSYSVQRPLKQAQETMKYRNPANIIQNINLQNVGRLLSVTTVSGSTVYDYDAVQWLQGQWWTSFGNSMVLGTATRIIRVIIDADNNEVDRYLVLKGGPNELIQAESNRVEVRKGDRINFSYDVRIDGGEKFGWRYFYTLLLTHDNFIPHSGSDSVVNTNGAWGSALPATSLVGFNHPSAGGGNGWYDWTNISVNSFDIPFDGVIILKLVHCHLSPGSTGETHYKNIKFEVVRNLAGNKAVIGHEHTDKQLLNIKNKDAGDIYVDNTMSNAIAGSLFLNSRTGPLQDLVKKWLYRTVQYSQLGQITTTEEMFWRSIPRLKLEGTIYNLSQSPNFLSALSVMQYTHYAGYNFIWGKLSIDYKRDKATGTLFEMYKDSEDIANFNNIYGFRYLFE